jgi:hypothetical protein
MAIPAPPKWPLYRRPYEWIPAFSQVHLQGSPSTLELCITTYQPIPATTRRSEVPYRLPSSICGTQPAFNDSTGKQGPFGNAPLPRPTTPRHPDTPN